MIILDTETTNLVKPDIADLKSQPHMIEIAMIKIFPSRDYEISDRYEALIKPGIPLDENEHNKITGLKDADLADAPTFLELFEEVAYFMTGEVCVVGHNVAFDIGVLVCELRRIGKEHAFPYPYRQICTVERTKHLTGQRLKLTDLYERTVGKPLKQQHRAMSDVMALYDIVKRMKI